MTNTLADWVICSVCFFVDNDLFVDYRYDIIYSWHLTYGIEDSGEAQWRICFFVLVNDNH